MLIRRHTDIAHSEITSRSLFENRRNALQAGGAALLSLGGLLLPALSAVAQGKAFSGARRSPLSTSETQTSFKDATSYNNFYEFGTGKDDPVERAGSLKTRPWTVMMDGECGKPRRWDIEELLRLAPIEERIYRLRCVEGWSMVIPWNGFPLSELIKRAEPTSRAR